MRVSGHETELVVHLSCTEVSLKLNWKFTRTAEYSLSVLQNTYYVNT